MSTRPWTYRVKRAVAHLLYGVGLLQLWQAIALRRKAVVLMYHRVLTAEERAAAASHPALVVDRDTFARQMTLLKRRFTVLSVAEFAEYVHQRRPFPPSTAIITFDDGWRDNYDNALPVLSSLQLPSLIFLPMNYIGAQRVFWQEALAQLLVRAVAHVRRDESSRAGLARLLEPVGLSGLLADSADELKPRVIAAVSAQKGLTRTAIEQLVGDLASAIRVPVETFARTDGFIDWPQVQAMASQGVTFGGHGVDHLLLTQVSDEQADAEITGSKAMLDDRLPSMYPTFSYPNGYYTPRVADKVKDTGYQLAFVAMGGPVTCDSDPYTLTRVNIHETVTDTEPLFLARLVGLF